MIIPGHYIDQEYLPQKREYYRPTEQGEEKRIKERLAGLKEETPGGKAMIEYIVLLIAGLAGGFGLGLLIKGRMAAGKIRDAEEEAARIVANAEREAETKRKEAVLEAKDKLYQARAEFEKENREKRQELQNQERRLTQKEENLEKKVDLVEKREVRHGPPRTGTDGPGKSGGREGRAVREGPPGTAADAGKDREYDRGGGQAPADGLDGG